MSRSDFCERTSEKFVRVSEKVARVSDEVVCERKMCDQKS